MKIASVLVLFLGLDVMAVEKRDARKYLSDINATIDKVIKNNKQKKNLCIADEMVFQKIKNTALKQFKSGFQKQDKKAISQAFLNKNLNIKGMNFNVSEYKGEHVHILKKPKKAIDLSNYFKRVSKINNVEVIVTNALIDKKEKKLKRMKLSGRFEISYFAKDKTRRIDRSNVNFKVVRTGTEWKIDEVILSNQVSLASARPSFKEITQEVGLNNIPNYLRREAISRGGYTLASGNYSGDTFNDLFVGTSKESLLYTWDNKSKKFVRDTKSIKNMPTLAKASAFGDFFNQGKQDLLVARFESQKDKRGVISEVAFYKNANTKFQKLEAPIVEKEVVEDPMPIGVADLNQDSFLDLYIGYPGARDFTSLDSDSNIDISKFKRQGLYLNNKQDKFTSKNNLLVSNDQYGKIYPHSALAFDYDQDNDMDLIVIDDRGNLSPLYENVDNKLRRTWKTIGFGLDDYGMSTAFSDIDNNGDFEILTSSVNFYAANRIKNSCLTNRGVTLNVRGSSALEMYSVDKKQSIVKSTKDSGLEFAGEGIGGVHFFDYNNDGFEDIYVSNGLWSGSSKNEEQDFSYLFVLLNILDPKEYSIQQLRELGADTKSEIMDLLISFRGDINNPKLKNTAMGSPSLGGYQRNKLFLNNGKGGFNEVAFLEGVDFEADGYVVSTIDIDKDNNLDLILRNADPGVKEVNFPVVQVLKNTRKQSNSVVLKLKARTSNFDAIGTIVKAKIGKKVFTRHLVAVQGTIQGERILHFGLGDSEKIDELEITWPNNVKQMVKAVKPGRYLIEENIQVSSY